MKEVHFFLDNELEFLHDQVIVGSVSDVKLNDIGKVLLDDFWNRKVFYEHLIKYYKRQSVLINCLSNFFLQSLFFKTGH
jgi:hypothetical protein